MKVLVVVEDDPDMRLLVQMTLGEEPALGMGGKATSAAQAVKEASRLQPDLVILDNFIEGDVTGLEVAPEIKAAAPHGKIILFSSYELADQVRSEPAVDAFVRKNQLPELLPTARRLLGLKEA